MSVLHICCNWADSAVFSTLCGLMAAQGLDQQVYVPEKRAADMGKRAQGPENLKVTYSLIVRPWDRALYYTKARRALPDLTARMALDEVKLVHAHTLFTDGAMAYRLHQAQGLPYVVSIRYTDMAYFFPRMPHLRGYARQILGAAAAIVFISPAYCDRAFAQYLPQALMAKAHVIPNGIDPAWLDGAPKTYKAGDPVRLAFAGKLTQVKRPMVAIQAMEALQSLMPETQVTLAIAGTGPLASRLARHPLVAKGKVELHGQLSGVSAMKAFYDDATLFLLPSAAETFGLVYLEAMSRGLPVLYTQGQGFDGLFPPGEVGFPVDGRHPQQIARHLQEALKGYDDRSRRCVALAASLPWQAAADKTLSLYRALAPVGT